MGNKLLPQLMFLLFATPRPCVCCQAKTEEDFEDLVRFLKMARNNVKDQIIDSELVPTDVLLRNGSFAKQTIDFEFEFEVTRHVH